MFMGDSEKYPFNTKTSINQCHGERRSSGNEEQLQQSCLFYIMTCENNDIKKSLKQQCII